jgi:putative MATE family efflux protein
VAKLINKPERNEPFFVFSDSFRTFARDMEKRDNFDFLTSAPVPKVIHRMAVPTIISMLVTSFYNIADTFFVGHLNTQSTAGVGIVFSVMYIIQAFGFYFGQGSGTYIARELGARRHHNARKMASTGFFFSFMFGCLLMIIGEVFLRPLSVMLGSTPTILPYTEKFMSIILIGAPFFTSSLTLNNQMRQQGNAALSMIGIVTGSILNIILDPLLIFVLGLGVGGAALSTITGQVVSFFILIRMAHSPKNIGITFKNFSPSWSFFKEIFYGGSPSLSRQGLASVSMIALNVSAGAYGDAAIAGMSIVDRLTTFIMSTVIGLGQGFQPLCGFCYGARLFSRMKSAYWYTVKIGTVFLVLCAAIGICFSTQIIMLFRNDPEVIKVGSAALIWQLSTFPFDSFTMASNMLTQVCRKSWRANILAAARQGLFFIPFVMILPAHFGILGVEMSQSWSDVCAFLLTIPIMKYTFNEFKLKGK